MKTIARLLLTASVSGAVGASALAAPFTAGNLMVFRADSSGANNTTFTILEVNAATPNQTVPANSVSINGTNGASALRTSGSATSTGYLADSDDGTLLLFTGHNTTTSTGNANTFLPRGIGSLDNAGNFMLQATYTGASGNQTRCATTTNNAFFWVGDQSGIYTNGGTKATIAGNFRAVKSFGGTIYVLLQSSVASNIVVSTIASNGASVIGLPGLTNDSTALDFALVSSGSNGSVFDVLYLSEATIATAGTIKKYSLVGGTWTANGSSATSFGGFGLCAATNGAGGAVLFLTSGTGATGANTIQSLTDAAGYNVTIAIGTPTALYTAPAGTTLKGIAFAPLAVVEPAVQASNVIFSNIGTNAMTVSWTPGNGARRVVVVAGGAVSWNPTDGVGAGGVNADFSVAADQGNGSKVCYDGTGTNFTLAGLSAGTPYVVEIFEYNGQGVTANYLTSGSPATGSQTTGGSANDKDSSVLPPTSEIGSLDLSSLCTAPTSAVPVFCFKVLDNGSGDGLPTLVTQISIRPGANNTAVWTRTLQGVVLSSLRQAGVVPVVATNIADTGITFSLAPAALSVWDGGNDDLTLSVYLKAGTLQDNSVLQFAIPATNHGFAADASGSQFASVMPADVVSATTTIRVAASQLGFLGLPSTVMAGAAFAVTVAAQDANGNSDLDAAQVATLAQAGGSATLIGGGTRNLSAGVAAWTGLQSFLPGTVVLQAQAAGLASATSAAIAVVSPPVLQAGDVAAVGFDAVADIFAVVALRTIPAGTIVYFTDNGWSDSNGMFRGVGPTSGAGSESLCKVTALLPIPVGTILQAYQNTALCTWTTNGTIPGVSNLWKALSFAQTGDQFYTFVSAVTNNPLYSTACMKPVYVFDDTKGFEDATDSGSGNVPPGLSTNAFTAVTFPTANTWALNVTDGRSRTKDQWLQYIADRSHWTSGTNGVMPGGVLSVTPDHVFVLSIR